jgi:hypothetical protein
MSARIMTKKKYFKSSPRNCKCYMCRRGIKFECDVHGHRKKQSKKYYGMDGCEAETY